jgi:hypothetical protein
MKGTLLEIPRELNKYDSSWFYNLIISHNSTYIIDDKDLSNLIDIIDIEDLKLVLYLIYKIIIEDSLKPKVSKIPNNGIELFNPINSELDFENKINESLDTWISIPTDFEKNKINHFDIIDDIIADVLI